MNDKSSKLLDPNSDLGNNKIIDIEDNAITSSSGHIQVPTNAQAKPERIVFVLMEKESCEVQATSSSSATQQEMDACSLAPRVNPPNFDSPCYNGGSCILGARAGHPHSYSNYSCLCPAGFAGPLCEINIDDCVDHQCQNEASCIDGINSYRCQCRDSSTSGEYCEQLSSSSSSTSSMNYATNSIAPIALPIISATPSSQQLATTNNQIQQQQSSSQTIQARSADLMNNVNLARASSNSGFVGSNSSPMTPSSSAAAANDLMTAQRSANSNDQSNANSRPLSNFPTPSRQYQHRGKEDQQNSNTIAPSIANGNTAAANAYLNPKEQTTDEDANSAPCRRVSVRKHFDDGNGCRSVTSLKLSECLGICSLTGGDGGDDNCCQATKIKWRKVRMVCTDNATYVKSLAIVKRCSCSAKCKSSSASSSSSSLMYQQQPATQPASYVNETNIYRLHNPHDYAQDQYGSPSSSMPQIDTIDAVDAV